MVAAGDFRQRLPGFYRDMTVGLGRELQDHLAGVDVGLDLRQTKGGAGCDGQAVELAELRTRENAVNDAFLFFGMPGRKPVAFARMC